jgi:pyruvate/2-oxoglutarate dehydrogenase complex dihydrolipoamide acyltransferase (E2) component
MLYKLVVPGPDDEEFRILEWHGVEASVHPADALIVEVETQKSVVEVRLCEARVLRKILVAVGAWQRYGEPIAVLSDRPDEEVLDDPQSLAAMGAELVEV